MVILPASWAAIQGLWVVHHMIAGCAAFGICPERWKPEAFTRLRLMPRADVSREGAPAPPCGSGVKPIVSSRWKRYVRIEHALRHGGIMACMQGGKHTRRSDGRRRGSASLRGGSRQEAAGSPYAGLQVRLEAGAQRTL
jgi:hypothetical protein